MRRIDRYVIGRESNVLRVDFEREPDPPAPRFPGGAAMHAPSEQATWSYREAGPQNYCHASAATSAILVALIAS
jgi:hypothetical protein